ncbi:ABC transporter ATP-binding protein [Dankookia rubra]|uniref:ABC transporter ATP-binding protein n=1 Tax=Dankookia rubra TaxID=1442381 RepID=A0A4R5QCY1_9PROT|nr:ABC transporter ATP-binding protein [Dankookia rubra]TDH60301.1 ABC transporter ATP-binding protein [Dankookia rubra]
MLDEPTVALDVSVQVTIPQFPVALRETLGISYVVVIDDLNVVPLLWDCVVVMYLGRIVGVGPAHAVFGAPLHPHTRGLVAAVPRLDGVRADALRLAGDPKRPIDPDPNACRLHGRCPAGIDRCGVEMPPLRRFPGGREAACR